MTYWCEREHDYVAEDEVKAFGGVLVHERNPSHLLTGEVIEMRGGQPLLDESGEPVIEIERPQVPSRIRYPSHGDGSVGGRDGEH